MKKAVIGMLAVAGLAAAANAGQVNLKQLSVIDVSGEFNGSTANGGNPSAVAWDGSNLFVAGFASAGGQNQQTAGIVKYDNAGAFQSSFGVAPGTPFNRGYSGLDISNGCSPRPTTTAAPSANGIAAYDLAATSSGEERPRRFGRRIDPGFGGNDSGVAWTTFGSGRRALQDSATGADIYTTGDGMIITPDFQGSFWRDMDFASNGDMVARRSNDVVFLSRTGRQLGQRQSLLVENNENGPFVNGQNVSYVESGEYGEFVIYNDRASGSPGQAAADVLKAVRLDGSEITLNFFGGPGFDLGNGYYDFSYDAATDTLAILDFNNRRSISTMCPRPAGRGARPRWPGCRPSPPLISDSPRHGAHPAPRRLR
jgi:hypothetical protein